MNTNSFRIFSCVDEAAAKLHVSGCENIRIAPLVDQGQAAWGPWVEISAAVSKILGTLSEDQLLIVEGQRGGKLCRPRSPIMGLVVAPASEVTDGKYTGPNPVLKGIAIDDESKVILDEVEESAAAPVSPPAPAPSPVVAPVVAPPAPPAGESPEALRAEASAAAQTKRGGRPKGGAAKPAAAADETANASPPITRPIAQIQIELDNNRTTLEKLHHVNAAAIAAVVQGNLQIESALKTEAALLGELEAAVKLQREQAEKARAALAALT